MSLLVLPKAKDMTERDFSSRMRAQKISSSEEVFVASGGVRKFDGYLLSECDKKLPSNAK